VDNADTIEILKQLERGEISANEAEIRLNAPPRVERMDAPPIEAEGAPQWVRRLWVYPLAAGILVVVFGAWIIAATVHANALWFLCGLPILLFGTFVLALAASVRSGHWMYVNIQASRKRRHNIRFGLPFPIGLLRGAVWMAKYFGQKPKARINLRSSRRNFGMTWSEDADAFFDALERELAEGCGVTIDVDDKDERVRVYIV
jgi:hypothetical protein